MYILLSFVHLSNIEVVTSEQLSIIRPWTFLLSTTYITRLGEMFQTGDILYRYEMEYGCIQYYVPICTL